MIKRWIKQSKFYHQKVIFREDGPCITSNLQGLTNQNATPKEPVNYEIILLRRNGMRFSVHF